ncbi:MAG: hypothetical protein PHU85_00155 [Phycisphaerae bacterium]|nr:hypothetical protein [Phycisphaerae bacterium]
MTYADSTIGKVLEGIGSLAIKAGPAVLGLATAAGTVATAFAAAKSHVDALMDEIRHPPGMEAWNAGFVDRALGLSRARARPAGSLDLSAYDAARAAAQKELRPLAQEYSAAKKTYDSPARSALYATTHFDVEAPAKRLDRARENYETAIKASNTQLDAIKGQAVEKYFKDLGATLKEMDNESKAALGGLQRDVSRSGIDLHWGRPQYEPKTAADREGDRRIADLKKSFEKRDITKDQFDTQTAAIRSQVDAINRRNDALREGSNLFDREAKRKAETNAGNRAIEEETNGIKRNLEAFRMGIDPRVADAWAKNLDPARIEEYEKAIKTKEEFDLEQEARTPQERFEDRLKAIKRKDLTDRARDTAIAGAYEETLGRARRPGGEGRLAPGGAIGSQEAYRLLAGAVGGAGPKRSERLQEEANAILRASFPDLGVKIDELIREVAQAQLVRVLEN